MSLQAVRAEIKTAVDSVAGLKGFEAKPPESSWVYGAAWPLWDGMRAVDDGYPIHSVALSEWRVVVVLGARGAEDVAMVKMDELLESGILAALTRVGFVESVVPALLPASAGEFLAAEITLRRE